MRRKERFLAAVNLHQPDRVPMFGFLFHQDLYQHLIGRRPEVYRGRDAVECALELNLDGVWLPFSVPTGYQHKYIKQDVYIDEWGVTYQKSPASWPIDAPIDYPIKSRADLQNFVPPDPNLAGRDEQIVEALSVDNDKMAITGGISGPLGLAWMLMGYEQIAYTLYDDPELLTEIFSFSNDYHKVAAERLVSAGCDAIWISEDLGENHRGFFKLDSFRKYILPSIAELIESVAGLGVPVLFHSCGRISEYLDDLAQLPINALNPLQRTAGMDLKEIKEKYGRRFCLIGNINSAKTLPFGTPDDVKSEVAEAIDIAAPNGGFILASDHSIHHGIPIENVITMYRTGFEEGKLACK